jgi:hypothetical protein
MVRDGERLDLTVRLAGERRAFWEVERGKRGWRRDRIESQHDARGKAPLERLGRLLRRAEREVKRALKRSENTPARGSFVRPR